MRRQQQELDRCKMRQQQIHLDARHQYELQVDEAEYASWCDEEERRKRAQQEVFDAMYQEQERYGGYNGDEWEY